MTGPSLHEAADQARLIEIAARARPDSRRAVGASRCVRAQQRPHPFAGRLAHPRVASEPEARQRLLVLLHVALALALARDALEPRDRALALDAGGVVPRGRPAISRATRSRI